MVVANIGETLEGFIKKLSAFLKPNYSIQNHVWTKFLFTPVVQFELGLFGYVKYVFDQLQRLARLFDQRLGIIRTRQCTYLYTQILLDEILSMYRILILTLFQTPNRIDMLSKIWRQHRCRSISIKAQKYSALFSFMREFDC